MRVHAVSTSPAILRTLHALITASGHSLAEADEAELLLVDHIHPVEGDLPACASISLGGLPGRGETLACPLQPQQLLRLLTTRRNGGAGMPLGLGWHLDPHSRTVNQAGAAPLTLTEKESALLAALATALPAGIAREALLAEVWGITQEIDTHTLETHIYRLRHKLADATPIDIVAEDGCYRLIAIPLDEE